MGVEQVLGAVQQCKSKIHQLGSSTFSVTLTARTSIYPIFIITPCS